MNSKAVAFLRPHVFMSGFTAGASGDAIRMVQMNFSNARKAPAKRAFSGMVGRDAPDDVKPQALDFEPPTHFQGHSNERGATFRRRAPDGTKHIEDRAASVSKAVQDITGVSSIAASKNSGISIEQHHVCRPDTPEWIRDDGQLAEFFRRQLEDAGKHGAWELTYGLDRAILVEHYLQNLTDEMIFEDHEEDFRRERDLLGRKQRWTSTVDAVKHRRLRLEAERKALFNPKKWTKNSWRGIVTVSNDSTLWETKYIGIATKRKSSHASGIVEFWGYHNHHEETAEIAADDSFDSWEDLLAMMAKYGITAADVVEDDRKRFSAVTGKWVNY
jgi:hypothetical protein